MLRGAPCGPAGGLPTPADLWQQAIELGQACRRIGRTVQSLDLLVAAVALHHKAERVTFDADFDAIASGSVLRLNRLTRPWVQSHR